MSIHSYSPDIEKFLKTTSEKYSHLEIELEEIELQENSIYAFFIKSNEEELDASWTKLNSWIGANFQPLLASEFQRWNLYLFFLIPDKVSTHLKYKIENNTLACRKLVVEGEKSIESIVEDYITIANLKVNVLVEGKKVSELDKDPELDGFLSNKSIRGKKNTQEAKTVFESLYQSLKSKSNESKKG